MPTQPSAPAQPNPRPTPTIPEGLIASIFGLISLLAMCAFLYMEFNSLPGKIASGRSIKDEETVSAALLGIIALGVAFTYSRMGVDPDKLGDIWADFKSAAIGFAVFAILYPIYFFSSPHIDTSGRLVLSFAANPWLVLIAHLVVIIGPVPVTSVWVRRHTKALAAQKEQAQADEMAAKDAQILAMSKTIQQDNVVIEAQREAATTTNKTHRIELETEKQKTSDMGRAAVYHHQQTEAHAQQTAEEKRLRTEADQRAAMAERRAAITDQEKAELRQQLDEALGKLSRKEQAPTPDAATLWERLSPAQQEVIWAVYRAGGGEQRRIVTTNQVLHELEDAIEKGILERESHRQILPQLAHNCRFIVKHGEGNQRTWQFTRPGEKDQAAPPPAP